MSHYLCTKLSLADGDRFLIHIQTLWVLAPMLSTNKHKTVDGLYTAKRQGTLIAQGYRGFCHRPSPYHNISNQPLLPAILLSPQHHSRPCTALPDHPKPLHLAALPGRCKNNPHSVKMKFQKSKQNC